MAASEEIRFYNEFDEQLQKCTLNTHHEACGRSYVRTHKMEAWWRGSALLRQEVTTQAARMLRYSYRSAKIETLLKPDVDDILAEGDRSFARILSILCELRLVKVIHQFRNKNLRDRDLPIEQSKLLDRFREMADAGLILVTDCEHLAHSFYQKQWKYCAEIIGADEFRDYDHDSIIPIHHKEVITDKGGTAKLWRIVVLKEFVHENLQNEAREYVPLGSKDDGQGPRYDFALKVYRGQNAKDHCDSERAAFRALYEHGGMVQSFGAYTHEVKYEDTRPRDIDSASTGRVKTYNMLLEWGTRDLIQFFQQELPPMLADEIQKFWVNLFAIATTLREVHNCQIKKHGVFIPYHGIHCDVKPENILEIDGKYKLADPGFANFTLKRSEDVFNMPVKALKGYTYTYGAPEVLIRDGNVNQTVDIWSLGCIFSIAASWIAFGSYEGIKQYSAYRKQAISVSLSERSSSGAEQLAGNYFHDGSTVLPEIMKWHKFLRTILRKTDTITARVLDIVDNYMLVGKPDLRLSSSDLCDELGKISASNKAPEIVVDEGITAFLRQQDEGIPEDNSSSTVTVMPSTVVSYSTFTERQNAKSSIESAPLKPTAHRSERATTSMSRVARANTIEIQSRSQIQPIIRYSGAAANTTIESSSADKRQSLSSHDSSQSLQSTPSIHESETVDDVHNAIAHANAKKQRLTLRKLRFGHKRVVEPDIYLKKYYHNRDIVFLIDNSETMAAHWPQLQRTIRALLHKVRELDDDGIDMYFTQGGLQAKQQKNHENVMSKLEAFPQQGVQTHAPSSLNDVFDDYKRRAADARRHHSKQKQLKLLFLTDGLWCTITERQKISVVIKKFITDLERVLLTFDEHSVGIEFVRFGTNLDVIEAFRWLDDEVESIAHIVDTEPDTGDVNKMLLGSFVTAYDESDTKSIANSTTSSTSQESTRTATPEDVRHEAAFLTSFASGGAFSQEPQSQSPTQILPRRRTDEASMRRSTDQALSPDAAASSSRRNRSAIRHKTLT